MSKAMADDTDGNPPHEDEKAREGSASLTTKMHLFSTWEVRNVPPNCVSR